MFCAQSQTINALKITTQAAHNKWSEKLNIDIGIFVGQGISELLISLCQRRLTLFY